MLGSHCHFAAEFRARAKQARLNADLWSIIPVP
jgi:hypothetical protein